MENGLLIKVVFKLGNAFWRHMCLLFFFFKKCDFLVFFFLWFFNWFLNCFYCIVLQPKGSVLLGQGYF